MKRHGFTSIELLVVIGIIGLLAALVFPVFAKVREKGRQTVCLSNERQLGMAMLQYVSDYDGTFLVNEHRGWARPAYPYVKNPAVFHCPDDDGQTLPGYDGRATYTAYPVSYGLNVNPCGHIGFRRPAATLAALAAPVKTVLFFEVTQVYSGLDFVCPFPNHDHVVYDDGSVSGNGATGVVSFTPRECPACVIGGDSLYATGDMGGRRVNGDVGSRARHNGGANYVACDGHARWLSPEAVSSGGSQLASGAECAQDTYFKNGACVPTRKAAAGTGNNKYTLTFSLN